MSVVSVKHVASYDSDEVYNAVRFHLESLCVPDSITGDMSILIKPNLLSARKPEQAVTTHHTVISAVVRFLRECGARRITIADSSGGLYNEEHMSSVYRLSGLMKPDLEEYLNHDFSFETVKTRDDFTVRNFNIISPAANADYIINLPKLKTHSMTTVSAGVKNLFGTIPGLQKPGMHCTYPDLPDFVRMLCELALTVDPDITLIDAIDSMDGNGPNAGTVKHTCLTAASSDIFALDVCVCEFMGLDPRSVPHLEAAEKMGVYPDSIEYTGDNFAPFPVPFTLPDSVKSPSFYDNVPPFLHPLLKLMRSVLRAYPKVDREKCVGCGRCAESCPQHIIEIRDGKAGMPRKGCISCFCCQEMCPSHAIDAKRFLNL